MISKDTLIKVTNRNGNRVGYTIPELHVRRQFSSRETKEIPFQELQSLVYLPGGLRILKEYLVIKDPEAIDELGIKIEPEYFYTEADVKKLLTTGTLDEFLDCLDFAPDGVLDMVKSLAVTLPLNDVEKRKAIQKKLNFNVTRAIEIRETNFDGGDEDQTTQGATVRRAAAPVVEEQKTQVQADASAIPRYKVTSIQE